MDRCSYCDRLAFNISASYCSINGSLKDAPSGCLRLADNGNSLSANFYSPYSDSHYATIYLRARVHGWASEGDSKYDDTYMTTKSGENTGAFKVEFNGSQVEMGVFSNTPYEELFPESPEIENYASTNWSYLAYCPIGQVSVCPGYNNISYTRLDINALSISEFFIIFAY